MVSVLLSALLWLLASAPAAPPARPAFVPPQVSTRATVWAVGDASASEPGARRLARLIRRSRPDLFLYLGDVYPQGSPSDFRRGYAPLYGALGARTAPTPGNHDWPLARVGYFPWWRAAHGRPLPAYYAFRVAGWRVLSLDSELRGAARARQLRWVRHQLRGGGSCRLAFWHRPRFSAGLHGDQPDLDPLWRALRGRVGLVLNGHDHDLQRMRRRDGITELVAGAGGHSLYPVDRSDRRLAFANDSVDGALRLRLSPGAARFGFVSAGGRLLDHGRVRCRQG